jgi:multidrug efflux pump subunit AcrA (membrane-fusion protein)
MLTGCHHAPKKNALTLRTLVIKPSTLHKTLHFTGTIQPLKESTLTSPVDAVIDAVHYHYGQWISRGMIVFTLNSAELQKRYNDTVTEYLKAKDSYTVARAKFVGTEDLWRAGLLSKNNYLSEKSSLNTERVTLMQSTRKISELLEKMGQGNSADDELAGLSFSEFDKVHLALMSKHNLLHLKAPSSGIFLYPPKTGDEKNTQLTVGSTVKTGQVLALIGDMRGIRIDIDVPEVDIGIIQQDMPVVIRGIAFNHHVLHGKIVAINAQASNKNASMLPSFTAIVEVKHLNRDVQKVIKVGMSATVDLDIIHQEKLLVPIKALIQQHGKTWLTLETSPQKTALRRVITGAVQDDQVVIEKGLNAGDIIHYED